MLFFGGVSAENFAEKPKNPVFGLFTTLKAWRWFTFFHTLRKRCDTSGDCHRSANDSEFFRQFFDACRFSLSFFCRFYVTAWPFEWSENETFFLFSRIYPEHLGAGINIGGCECNCAESFPKKCQKPFLRVKCSYFGWVLLLFSVSQCGILR